MGISLEALALMVICGAAAACSGGSPSPTAPGTGGSSSGATCRTFATKATAIDDGTPSATGLTVTGSFNSSTRQFTSTTTFPGNSSICTTVVFNYSSIADFVDEVSVVPPRALTT